MIINCSFSGCSCGCTPRDSAHFEGDEPDIYIAIAKWAMDYTVYGDNPFRKLNIPQQSKDLLLKVYALSGEIKGHESGKATLLKKAASYETSAKTLGVDVPADKQREMETDRATISGFEEKIKDLSDQKAALLRYDETKIGIRYEAQDN
jgi:hypothetical protein